MTLVVLAITVVVLMTGGGGAGLEAVDFTSGSSAYGVLQASGLMFFAFAGYARIATMGEEVLDPARTIPLAITAALGITVLIYLTVAAAALTAVGPNVLAHSPAPLAAAATRSGAAWLVPVFSAGAAVASLGALLALLTGIGRTSLAMGRNGDLPTSFARVHSRHGVPRYAQVSVAVVVALLVLLTDLRGVIGFSSFGVLVYYGIANVSAFTQDQQHRRWPRALNMLGVAGCLLLVGTLPPHAVLAGVVMLSLGLTGRRLLRR